MLIKVGFPNALIHMRHHSMMASCAKGVGYRILPEASLYKIQGLIPYYWHFLPFLEKDRGLEIFRGVYCFQANKVHLIHSYNRVILNRIPWVLDVDSLQRVFPQLSFLNLYKPAIVTYLLKNRFCCFILPWSQFCQQQFNLYIKDDEIMQKVKVIYPGITLPAMHNKTKQKYFRILFIGHDFLRKGGHWLLKSFLIFSQENENIHLTVVGRNVPFKYQQIMKAHPFISWYKNLSQRELKEDIYPNHDVLILPTRYEFFGLAILEAMSYGLTVVTTDIGAIKEIIEDKKEGILIPLSRQYHQANDQCFNDKAARAYQLYDTDVMDKGVIKKIIMTMKFLVKNSGFIRSVTYKARKKIETKFSSKREGEQWKQIYEKSCQVA